MSNARFKESAWAARGPATSSSASASRMLLRARGGEPPEVVDHDASLGGRQSLQFLPAWHLQASVGILQPGAQRRGQQHTVAGGGGALPFLLLVLLLALQGAAGV